MVIGFDEIQVTNTDAGSVVTLVFKGKLDRRDYEVFVPQLEWLIEKNKSIALLLELIDFKGWTVGALWEDTKFVVKHFDDIRKLALVGEGKHWGKGVAAFIKPFTRAEVRHFDAEEKDEAMAWLGT